MSPSRRPTTVQQPVFDRARERAELDRAWRSGKPELIIAAGRRLPGLPRLYHGPQSTVHTVNGSDSKLLVMYVCFVPSSFMV